MRAGIKPAPPGCICSGCPTENRVTSWQLICFPDTRTRTSTFAPDALRVVRWRFNSGIRRGFRVEGTYIEIDGVPTITMANPGSVVLAGKPIKRPGWHLLPPVKLNGQSVSNASAADLP